MTMMLLRKAIIPGKHTGDLFAMPVQIKEHTTKTGVVVHAHTETRMVHAAKPHENPHAAPKEALPTDPRLPAGVKGKHLGEKPEDTRKRPDKIRGIPIRTFQEWADEHGRITQRDAAAFAGILHQQGKQASTSADYQNLVHQAWDTREAYAAERKKGRVLHPDQYFEHQDRQAADAKGRNSAMAASAIRDAKAGTGTRVIVRKDGATRSVVGKPKAEAPAERQPFKAVVADNAKRLQDGDWHKVRDANGDTVWSGRAKSKADAIRAATTAAKKQGYTMHGLSADRASILS